MSGIQGIPQQAGSVSAPLAPASHQFRDMFAGSSANQGVSSSGYNPSNSGSTSGFQSVDDAARIAAQANLPREKTPAELMMGMFNSTGGEGGSQGLTGGK